MKVSTTFHKVWLIVSFSEGYFAFADGPLVFRRLSTAPFYLDRNALFVFSYHKVDKASVFRLLAKRAGTTEEELLFEV